MAVTLVLNVFTGPDGRGGNPLGVVLDAEAIAPRRRQEIAAQLGYSETIFVEHGARIAIHTPTRELPFAGHPLVGAAWLLGVAELHPPAGPVQAGRDGERAWIVARAEDSPAWETVEHGAASDVEGLSPPREGHVSHWAWLDEAAGRVRVRVFAPDYGVPEDPATGSAAIVLAAQLGRELTIEQGTPASEIHARPLGDGRVRLGGRVRREP